MKLPEECEIADILEKWMAMEKKGYHNINSHRMSGQKRRRTCNLRLYELYTTDLVNIFPFRRWFPCPETNCCNGPLRCRPPRGIVPRRWKWWSSGAAATQGFIASLCEHGQIYWCFLHFFVVSKAWNLVHLLMPKKSKQLSPNKQISSLANAISHWRNVQAQPRKCELKPYLRASLFGM